jgi:hypothetical protein
VQESTHSTVHISDGVNVSISGIEFKFVLNAVISSIEPKRGPSSGGTKVKLYGSGFANADSLECDFGSERAKAQWVSVTELECQVPKRQVELDSVGIALNLNGVRFPTNHAEFKYYETPAIYQYGRGLVPRLGGRI